MNNLTFKKELNRKLDGFELADYEKIKKQIREDASCFHGNTINELLDNVNILIISDRALGRAMGLQEYIVSNTKVKRVQRVHNFSETQAYIKCLFPQIIDLIIFVGYQSNNENYFIIKEVEKTNNQVITAMYSFADDVTYTYCKGNNIDFMIDSFEPVYITIKHLHYNYHLIKSNKFKKNALYDALCSDIKEKDQEISKWIRKRKSIKEIISRLVLTCRRN